MTDVDSSTDLRTAIVYFSSLSEEALEGLDERRVAIQSAVGRQSSMKRTPRLTFAVDPAVTEGARIDEALRRLGEDRPEI